MAIGARCTTKREGQGKTVNTQGKMFNDLKRFIIGIRVLSAPSNAST
jgi:hypothetical protein